MTRSSGDDQFPERDTHKSAPLRIPSFSSQELEHAIESYDCKCLEDPSEDYDLLVSGLLRKNTISKACRLAVKESIQAYRRLKLLEAAQKGSSIKRCKRDLCDQKAVIKRSLPLWLQVARDRAVWKSCGSR
ncbi:hypothetical protein Q1695_008343 [Nippostrongylus brasiliensis]|nr:hypothetical protein Q1695_008343 [Nippostrongylus brasiliensis]